MDIGDIARVGMVTVAAASIPFVVVSTYLTQNLPRDLFMNAAGVRVQPQSLTAFIESQRQQGLPTPLAYVAYPSYRADIFIHNLHAKSGNNTPSTDIS